MAKEYNVRVTATIQERADHVWITVRKRISTVHRVEPTFRGGTFG